LLRAVYPVNLLEMLTVKSDDMTGRVSAYEAQVSGNPLKRSRPEASRRLESTLRASCFNVCLPSRHDADASKCACPDAVPIRCATVKEVRSWSFGAVRKP